MDHSPCLVELMFDEAAYMRTPHQKATYKDMMKGVSEWRTELI